MRRCWESVDLHVLTAALHVSHPLVNGMASASEPQLDLHMLTCVVKNESCEEARRDNPLNQNMQSCSHGGRVARQKEAVQEIYI